MAEGDWVDGSAEVEGIELSGNRRVVKVNVPDNWIAFKSGNGEGMWGFIRREEDLPKYDQGEGEFEIILLNTSIYWPQLPWGTVITAEGRGKHNRPVICERQFRRLVAEREAYFKTHPEERLG